MQPSRRKKPPEGARRGATATQLKNQINELRIRVTALEQELEILKTGSEEDVIELRIADREQAKREIQELFQSGETLFYSDISRRLGIELPLVVEICQELESAGEVELDAKAV